MFRRAMLFCQGSDMSIVLSELRAMDKKFEIMVEGMDKKFESKFEIMDKKFEAMDTKFEAKLDLIDQKMDARWGAYAKLFHGSIVASLLVLAYVISQDKRLDRIFATTDRIGAITDRNSSIIDGLMSKEGEIEIQHTAHYCKEV